MRINTLIMGPRTGRIEAGTSVRRIGIAVLVGIVTGLALWVPQHFDERSHVEHITNLAARSVQQDILADLDSEILEVIRLAKLGTFEESPSKAVWQSNARLFLEDHPSYIAIYWANPEYAIEWETSSVDSHSNAVEPDTGIPVAQALQNALALGHKQLQQAEQPALIFDLNRDLVEATVSSTFVLGNGKRAARIVVPVHKKEHLIGFLVATFEINKAFHRILADHSGLGYAVSVLEGDNELFRMHGGKQQKPAFAQDVDIRLRGAAWHIRVWPESELLDKIGSSVPEIVFFIAALLGISLVLTMNFAEAARVNAKSLKTAHEEMESRVEQRTAEVHALSGRLLQLQDAERRHIARELHDSTAQVLAGAAFSLEKSKSLALKQPTAAAGLVQAIDDSANMVEQATSEVRTISYLLHPPMLDDLGLLEVVRWFADGFSKRSGITVALDLQADIGRLSREMELALFRIVQESLTNVHRHSGSRSATIAVGRIGDKVRVTVTDNGRGFVAEKDGKEAGLSALGVGIRGMEERVRQLGGTLSVISSVGQGTQVEAALPVGVSMQYEAAVQDGCEVTT
jgi:signal transduction histidine kinase